MLTWEDLDNTGCVIDDVADVFAQNTDPLTLTISPFVWYVDGNISTLDKEIAFNLTQKHTKKIKKIFMESVNFKKKNHYDSIRKNWGR